MMAEGHATGIRGAGPGIEHCKLHHLSSQGSPCPSCAGALPPTIGQNADEPVTAENEAIEPHYDDVVPTGIRRPPRSS